MIGPLRLSVMNQSYASATSYDEDVLALNPSAYWRLNEASGLTAVDEVAARNGTYQGSILYRDAGLTVGGDRGVKFNDADDNAFNDVLVAPNSLWNLSLGGSLVVWFRRNSDEFFNFLISQWDANDGLLHGWELLCPNTGGGGPARVVWVTRSAFSIDSLLGVTTVNDDARHMAGITIDALGVANIYVDGVLDATATMTLPGPRTDSILTIGADWEPINSKMWMGKVALWGGATPVILTGTQMAALYAKGVA